jgi:hypothetical protein
MKSSHTKTVLQIDFMIVPLSSLGFFSFSGRTRYDFFWDDLFNGKGGFG